MTTNNKSGKEKYENFRLYCTIKNFEGKYKENKKLKRKKIVILIYFILIIKSINQYKTKDMFDNFFVRILFYSLEQKTKNIK